MTKTVAVLVKERLQQHDQALADRWDSVFIQARPWDKENRRQDQIRAINHFWRIQLGSLNDNTLCEREALVDDATFKDWFRLFEEEVLPTIVRHRLPR